MLDGLKSEIKTVRTPFTFNKLFVKDVCSRSLSNNLHRSYEFFCVYQNFALKLNSMYDFNSKH